MNDKNLSDITGDLIDEGRELAGLHDRSNLHEVLQRLFECEIPFEVEYSPCLGISVMIGRETNHEKGFVREEFFEDSSCDDACTQAAKWLHKMACERYPEHGYV